MSIPQLLALSHIQHTAPLRSKALGVSAARRAHGSTILYAEWELCPSLCEEDLQQTQELWAVP